MAGHRPGTARGVQLFLCGDVMTGRGVDQILSHPGDPQLWDGTSHDARGYVALAEAVSGPSPGRSTDLAVGRRASGSRRISPDVRVINLETSITQRDSVDDGKAVHYRMHPANVGCLVVARPDACVLANNHVLDFGPEGLADTLERLGGRRSPAPAPDQTSTRPGGPSCSPCPAAGV